MSTRAAIQSAIALVFCFWAALLPAPPASAQETAPYYIAVDGAQVGPLDLAALKKRIEDGQMTKQTLVWTSGMANWTPAGNVAALAEFFRIASTPEAAPGRDFKAFLLGTWITDPLKIPIEGFGTGTAVASYSYFELGNFEMKGSVEILDISGTPIVRKVKGQGTFKIEALSSTQFKAVLNGSIMAEWPDVGLSKAEDIIYEIIDDNTLRDQAGAISRRLR